MTPQERAKWCIAQAEAIERELPPKDDDITTMPELAAELWREFAFIALSGTEGRA